MAAEVSDLEELEVAVLGVLSLGLPPSRAAGDETFRVDHCVAVVEGLRRNGSATSHLVDGGPAIASTFAESLAGAMASLEVKGLVVAQPHGLPAAPGEFDTGLEIDVVNPDTHPAVLDRRLAQQCLDRLLGLKDVYPFLMQQYARAGEFWRSARASGYGE
ncbi:MAG TPA: hypothetical protein QGF35_06805 [Dehalococcoidia bacterium]|nr:hypothetical protein [Dehalococcoidia bacterium]